MLINCDITPRIYAPVLNYLCKTETKGGKPTILIHSDGGDLGVALALYDLFKLYSVRTVALGDVSSAAVIVFAGGIERLALPNSSFFWHDPFFQPGEAYKPTLRGASVTANDLRRVTEAALHCLERSSSKPAAFWRGFGRDGGRSFGTEEAERFGLVSQLLGQVDHGILQSTDAFTELEDAEEDGD